MKACIIRHAEAVPRESAPSPRPLTEKGREDARRLGLFLKDSGFGTARVLHNGRSWVQENAEIVAGILQKASGAIIESPAYSLNSKADLGPFIADLCGAADDVVAALPDDVAHRVSTRLIAGRETPYAVSMTNGDALCLERGDDDTWRLLWFVTAKQLEDLTDRP